MASTEVINFTEFNTLAACERKFVYAYHLNLEEQGEKRGLHLGTLCHLWHGRWLLGLGATLPDIWQDDINTGGKPGEVRMLSLEDFDPALVTRARWLAERFVKVYGSQPPSSWTVISAEEWMTREFDWGTLVGRSDGFVEIDGQLYLIEVKTYGAKPGPLAYAQVSPQLGCYSLLAESTHGRRPFGIIYQGIYTYQWKPSKPTQADLIAKREATEGREWDWTAEPGGKQAWARAAVAAHPGYEREPEESFQQLEVELGDDHLRTAELYLASALKRRADLLGGEHPIPNVGRDCSWCGFKARCWNDLGGVEEAEIEVEDDDAEPV